MKKVTPMLTALLLASAIALPAASAASEAAPAAAPAKTTAAKLLTDGAFAALQVGNKVSVHDEKGQLFQTNGKFHNGTLKDLFVVEYGPMQVPMVVVQNKGELLVFSDLWPEFAKGKENNNIEEYFCGRILTKAANKYVTRTGHHFAQQVGGKVEVYTANDFGDLKKGHHKSFEMTGKLRGLLLFDCCPYAVIENADGTVGIYHAGENGPEQITTVNLS
ncbi:hypothetical protein [Paenibacillus xanthanilyticus]|uniref:Uncharacterized protein n=1 Tax=Paenibacillus xanthanilyticus TaxID=1783531 RepID=A0ABV8K499_9BACL